MGHDANLKRSAWIAMPALRGAGSGAVRRGYRALDMGRYPERTRAANRRSGVAKRGWNEPPLVRPMRRDDHHDALERASRPRHPPDTSAP
jgi:hypothetical protein